MTKDAITLQKQPTPITCIHTCLAMVLGVPVRKVIDRYGPNPLNQAMIIFALTECRVIFNQFVFGTPAATGWYLMSVPSLNVEGGMHQIVAHYDMDRGCNGWTIFDPSTRKNYAPDGSNLRTWGDLILFHPGGKLPE